MDVVTHFGLSQDPFRSPEPDSLAGGMLTPEAARAYLAGRIAGAGGPDLFARAALDILVEAANGDPDLLRRLGGSALFHAAFEGARQVGDQHARQAVVTQGGRVTPVPVHDLGAEIVAAAAVAPADPAVVHRRWWRRTPPLTRLAIVVGLLLLSLPVVGYVIGAVKDSQAGESSYLPENSIVDAERIAPAETEVADAANPDAAIAGGLDRMPARPPVALPTPAAVPVSAPRPVSRPERAVEAPIEAAAEPEPETTTEPEPLPVEEPSPPQLETVPIDPPAAPAVETAEPTPQPDTTGTNQ